MVGPDSGFTVTPHHRSNRRRERPGSRSRRTITRKANLHNEFMDGLLVARDVSLCLPSDKAKPSPLLRQNFDQSWQRWKARQAEEKALEESSNIKMLEEEQLRLFGGDVDDDELHRMGILYNDDEDTNSVWDDESNTNKSCDVSVAQATPMFVFRHGKSRHSQQSSNRRHVPPCLSLSSFTDLSDDVDIARLLSSPVPTTSNQAHTPASLEKDKMDIPLSLLPYPELPESVGVLDFDTTSVPSSAPNTPIFETGDWTLIPTQPSNTKTSTPVLEPETWILIDDL